MSIFDEDKKYIAGTYNRFDVAIKEGKGSVLYDFDGKEYIDMGAGIAVNGFGLCDERWIEAVTKQLSSFQHTSNLYYAEPQVQLARLLCEKSGMQKVFFSNSGAEANECAIKAARKYSSDKYGDDRNFIVTLKNSFHGRTVTTLSATGQDVFHKSFGPFTGGFIYTEPNDIPMLEGACNKKVCAVMIELIQGEGGINVLEKDFVEAIRRICAERDILLIVDEVQTGNGRTGKLFCYMHYGIDPDIVSTAKGLAGGLPMGATLFGEKTKDVLGAGDHGSTFGGNPVCAAGALSILSRIDEALLNQVNLKSAYIRSELSAAKGVLGISGMGLMLGIETEKDAKDVVKRCQRAGVLVLTAKNKVRLLPALTIGWEELKRAIEILKGIIEA